MDTLTLLNAPYLPMLIHEYFIHRNSIRHTERFKKVCACLEEFGVLENIDDLSKLYSMFTYNENFASGSKGGRDNYDLLLRGLTETFKYERSSFWADVFESNPEWEHKHSLADVCCGDGFYSKAFLEHNPDGAITLIDRPGVVDKDQIGTTDGYFDRLCFEVDLLWDAEIVENFFANVRQHDLVLLSEVLHLKATPERNAILKICNRLLKKNGHLIIVESNDPFLDFRLHDLTESGASMSKRDVELAAEDYSCVQTVGNKLKLTRQINIGRNHHVSFFGKL